MSKTTHYELNTPIGSEVLSVMTGLNPNFNTIDETMYDNETRSTQALNKANVNEQNIATALGRITTAEGDIDTLESGLQTANTNISGLTSRMETAEANIVSANNRIQENTNQITQINTELSATQHERISVSATTGATGNIALGLDNDGVTYVSDAFLSGRGCICLPFVAHNNEWFVKVINGDNLQPLANTAVSLRYVKETLTDN